MTTCTTNSTWLGSRGGTFTDVACRLKTSCSASVPRNPVVVLASAGRTWADLEFCWLSAVPLRYPWDDCDDLAAALGGVCRCRHLAGQRRSVIMRVGRGDGQQVEGALRGVAHLAVPFLGDRSTRISSALSLMPAGPVIASAPGTPSRDAGHVIAHPVKHY
jgi:hypothetical protein